MRVRDPEELGQLLRRVRSARGLRQADIAASGNMRQATVSEIEAGKETAQIGLVMRTISSTGLRLQVVAAPGATVTGSLGRDARLQRITDAVGVRSPSRPSAEQVHAAVMTVLDGRPLQHEQASVVRRVVMDANPWDLRHYLGSDARTAAFLTNVLRQMPALRRPIYAVSIGLGLGPEVVIPSIAKAPDAGPPPLVPLAIPQEEVDYEPAP